MITTIQRLYSILRGEEEFDETLETESAFETQAGSDDEPRKEVVYQPKVPIETFDFIFTDECHRSIYGKWGEVLDYFDAFLVGLTATPSKFTYGYFRGNVILDYTHEQSVIDGVNVDYNVYRIDTAITRAGATIERGEWVQVRDRLTREQAFTELADEITYDPAKLDRAVVAPDQIRKVVRTFRDKVCTEIFPGRTEVPKTIVFCKNDSHAEDVLQAFRDEFGRGSEFAKKVTYRSEESAQQLIRQFRNDPVFRVAVSVDQIATGTDIKPVECLLFMRMVGSRSLFEQMKGRGVRRINPDELQAVTPDARVKDHFVIVDAVGITDEDRAWADSRPLDREPVVPLKTLLQRVAEGADSDELLTTIGSRLLRLDRRLNDDQREEIAELLPPGTTLVDLAASLIQATERRTNAPRPRPSCPRASSRPTSRSRTARQLPRRRRAHAAGRRQGPPADPRHPGPDPAAHRPRHPGPGAVRRLRRRRPGRRTPCRPSSSSSTSTTTSTSRSPPTTSSRSGAGSACSDIKQLAHAIQTPPLNLTPGEALEGLREARRHQRSAAPAAACSPTSSRWSATRCTPTPSSCPMSKPSGSGSIFG